MPPRTAANRTKAKADPDNLIVALSSLNLVQQRNKSVATKIIKIDAFIL